MKWEDEKNLAVGPEYRVKICPRISWNGVYIFNRLAM